MSNIMVRMGVVIGSLLAVQVGFALVGRLSHPDVVELQQRIDGKDEDGKDVYAKDKNGKDVRAGFPTVVSTPEIGTWEGKDAQLDERSFTQSEADVAVSRIYSKEGHNVKFLMAEYKSRSVGALPQPDELLPHPRIHPGWFGGAVALDGPQSSGYHDQRVDLDEGDNQREGGRRLLV